MPERNTLEDILCNSNQYFQFQSTADIDRKQTVYAHNKYLLNLDLNQETCNVTGLSNKPTNVKLKGCEMQQKAKLTRHLEK